MKPRGRTYPDPVVHFGCYRWWASAPFAARLVLTWTWGWAWQNFIDSENCPDKWLCDFIFISVWYGLSLVLYVSPVFFFDQEIFQQNIWTHILKEFSTDILQSQQPGILHYFIKLGVTLDYHVLLLSPDITGRNQVIQFTKTIYNTIAAIQDYGCAVRGCSSFTSEISICLYPNQAGVSESLIRRGGGGSLQGPNWSIFYRPQDNRQT